MECSAMGFYTALAVALSALVLSAFFSGLEIAFISSNRVRAGLDRRKKRAVSRIIDIFYTHRDVFSLSMSVGYHVMLVAYGIGMAALVSPLSGMLAESTVLSLCVQILVSTGVILAAGKFLPRAVMRINPNDSLRHFAVAAFAAYVLLYPISWSVLWLSRLLLGQSVQSVNEKLTAAELDEYIQQAMAGNVEDG